MAGRGVFFFFSRRDGAFFFFFRGGTGWLFFFFSTGRDGAVFFFFSRAGTGRLFWRDGAKSLHRPAKGGLNRPASRPCKALIIYGLSCSVSSMFFFLSCHRIISHDRIYVEQKESIGGQILSNAKTICYSVHATDSVVFRICQLVVSSLFGQSQSFIFDRFCRQILMNRFYPRRPDFVV